MPIQTAERQGLHQAVDTLSDSSIVKLVNYIDFLRYEERMEELEDEEDIEYIKSLAPEDYAGAVSLEDVTAKYKAVK